MTRAALRRDNPAPRAQVVAAHLNLAGYRAELRNRCRYDGCSASDTFRWLRCVTALAAGHSLRSQRLNRKTLAVLEVSRIAVEKYAFKATIEAADGGGAYVTVPFDAERAFGKRRIPVVATIDGIPYRGSLVRMGGECHVLGILKEIRSRIGRQVGDVVEIVLAEDTEPRVVDVPSDFQEALRLAPEAKSAFDALSFSHQREYVNWIADAKRNVTRQRRICQAVEMLKRGEGRR